MRIDRHDSVVLVIDIQNRLFPLIHKFEELETASLKLIEGMKALDIPFIVTEQYPKGLGTTIESVQSALGEMYKPIEKSSFSCIPCNEFMVKLNTHHQKNVIILGIEAHVCVLQTVIDLIADGFNPVVVADCVSSRTAENKAIALDRMRAESAIITSYESILFELCEESGTDEFRAVSKIVK